MRRSILSINSFEPMRAAGAGSSRTLHVTLGAISTWNAEFTSPPSTTPKQMSLLKRSKRAPWGDREMVQVFVKEEEEELFKLRYSWVGSER
jgi:hypothetical protein